MKAQGLQSDGSWILDGMSIRDQVLELDRDSGSDDKISEAWTDAARQASAETRRANAKGEAPSSPGGAADSSPSNSGGKAATKTPEFKAWFGGSKVVDDKGEPLVVHRGSRVSLTTFDPKRNDPIYFSSDKRTAQGFADMLGTEKQPGIVESTYLKITNPLILTPKAYSDHEDAEHKPIVSKPPWGPPVTRFHSAWEANYDGSYVLHWAEQLRDQKGEAAGHDGLIIRHVNERGFFSDVYVVRSVAQIKSAAKPNA